MNEAMERTDEMLPELGYLAAGTTAMLEKLSREALAPFGITPVEIAILTYCYRNQGNTTEKLVGAVHLNPASVSRHLSKLVGKGLIRRTRPFPDRRMVRLELTDRGQAFMPRLVESLQDTNSLVNAGIGAEDRRVFLEVLGKIHENLRTGLHEPSTTEPEEDRGE